MSETDKQRSLGCQIHDGCFVTHGSTVNMWNHMFPRDVNGFKGEDDMFWLLKTSQILELNKVPKDSYIWFIYPYTCISTTAIVPYV